MGEARCRVHERRVAVPQVAAEHERALLVVIVVFQLHDRRAEDVPRVEQRQHQARNDFDGRLVLESAELADRGFGVFARVERLDRGLALARTLLVLPLGLSLVQVAGVRQHDLAQGLAGRMCVDGPLVALLHERLLQRPAN